MALGPFDPPSRVVADLVGRALDEDLLPLGDLSAALLPAGATAAAEFVVRTDGVVAGIACATETFRQVDESIDVAWHVADGDRVTAGQVLGTVTGPLASVLTAERTALNFLGHLSGIATRTRAFVDAAAPLRVWDTRKTTPGLRSLEKAAVRAGGARNHRGNLSDWVMFKDNHLTALGHRRRGAPAPATRGRVAPSTWSASASSRSTRRSTAGADAILLDNMSPDEVRACVIVAEEHAASGGHPSGPARGVRRHHARDGWLLLADGRRRGVERIAHQLVAGARHRARHRGPLPERKGPPVTSTEAPPRFGVAALVGVGLVGVYSATWRLDRSDWKLDEDAYAQAGWVLVHEGVDPNLGHPPFAKLLFGASQVAARSQPGRGAVGLRPRPSWSTMAVLFVFGRRIGGWWTGVMAAGLFAVVPRSMAVAGWEVADLRIDRYGFLEAVAGALVLVGALARLALDHHRRMALGGAVAGALLGLAGASKLNSLVVLVPIVVLGLALRLGSGPPAGRGGARRGRTCVAFVLPFWCSGAGPSTRSSRRSASRPNGRKGGHLLVLGSDVYVRSPWWAHLRYQWDADGPLLVVAVVVGLGLRSLASRRRLAVVYLLGGHGQPLVRRDGRRRSPSRTTGRSGRPRCVLLVAIGIIDQLERVAVPPVDRSDVPATGERGRRLAGPVVAGAALTVLIAVGAVTMVQLATLGAGDYRHLADRGLGRRRRPRADPDLQRGRRAVLPGGDRRAGTVRRRLRARPAGGARPVADRRGDPRRGGAVADLGPGLGPGTAPRRSPRGLVGRTMTDPDPRPDPGPDRRVRTAVPPWISAARRSPRPAGRRWRSGSRAGTATARLRRRP